MIATISEGHGDLADVLFLIAAIVFGLLFILQAANVAIPPKWNIIALGLCLVSIGWFVL